MSDKLKNLVVRTVSGIGLTVVVLGGILWSQWSLGAVLLLLLVGGMWEFYNLSAKQAINPQRFLGLLAGVLLFALNFAFVSNDIEVLGAASRLFAGGLAMLLLLVPLMFICELYRKQPNPAANIGATLMGVCYVALPLSLTLYLPIIGSEAWNPWVLIAYICIVWSNDVFAYLVGMAIGRRRLFERLSPKKSWEGFFGGLVGAVVAGVVVAHLMHHDYITWGVLAVVVAVTAVFGDLAESMFKRAADVKDSGALIPGHGGVLDRFDALLLSAPFVFIYMLFVF
nr:phosphatidate cytidylyltransferase [Rikenellaceae bacterium]